MNILNIDHIAANEKSREVYDNIEWDTKKECWLCGGTGWVFIPNSEGGDKTECLECK